MLKPIRHHLLAGAFLLHDALESTLDAVPDVLSHGLDRRGYLVGSLHTL